MRVTRGVLCHGLLQTPLQWVIKPQASTMRDSGITMSRLIDSPVPLRITVSNLVILKTLVDSERIELSFSACKAEVLPLNEPPTPDATASKVLSR